MKRWVFIAVGLLLQALLGVPASYVSLIGTQGMHGDEFWTILLFPVVALGVVHLVAAAIGLIPVAIGVGNSAYKAGIKGGLAGALLASILFRVTTTLADQHCATLRECDPASIGAAQPVCLLMSAENSNRLVSLLDMLKFNAHHFVAMSSTLGQAIIEFGRPNYIPHQDSLRMMAETCAQLQKDCEGLGLRLTVSHIKRFREDVLQYGVAFAAMRTYLVEIQQRVWDELELKLFLALEPTEQEFYAEPLRDWGFIIARFPNIRDDVEEARKCYALERYGASIFHLMRVTEAAALELGQLVDPHDHKPQFGSVLKKIDNLIQKTQWHDWPSDAQPHKALFADVLPRLYAVKDSWRDKVSHFDTHIIPTSATSNRERAFDIYNSTVSLLNLLAERLPRRTR